MRLIKMLGLAAIAALAAMAFAGAGTASAQEHFEVLCKENPAELCPGGELYPSGTKLLAELEPLGENEKHAVLLGPFQNELCAVSHVEGEITTASPIHGLITELTFKECSPCTTVEVKNLPYLVEIKHDLEGEHLWLMRVTGTSGLPILVEFSCPFFKCSYEATEVVLDVENNEGLPLILTLKNKLTRHAGPEIPCGNVGEWDANYLITSPDPAWLALDEN